MVKRYGAVCVAVTVAVGCSADPAPTTPRPGVFGTLTMEGPRVSGMRRGQITVGSSSGVGYDLDGDGDSEEIDVDGDGISDGEDIDGDGVITIWDNLRTGDVPSMHPERELPATDPDFIDDLDPTAPALGNSAGGMVNEPAALTMVPANLLRAGNQGQQSSCGAWTMAAAAALTRYQREARSMPMLRADSLWASPSWLYTRMFTNGMSMCNQGTTLNDGLNILVNTGSATLMEAPYRAASNGTICDALMPDPAMAPHHYRIGAHRSVPTGAGFRAMVKESLAAGLPVVFGLNLPRGFSEFRATVAGVDVTQPLRTNGVCMDTNHCGGHAMLFVGYDDSKNAYRVLNSWGTDWGDNGYLWWDYASLEGQPNLHAHVITPLPEAPAPLAAPDPQGFAMTVPMGARPVLTRQAGATGGAATWRLIQRVRFSEPITLTEITMTTDAAQALGLDTTMLYGDLSFDAPGDAMPAAGTMATLRVVGRLRNGMMVTREMMVAVPAPMTAP